MSIRVHAIAVIEPILSAAAMDQPTDATATQPALDQPTDPTDTQPIIDLTEPPPTIDLTDLPTAPEKPLPEALIVPDEFIRTVLDVTVPIPQLLAARIPNAMLVDQLPTGASTSAKSCIVKKDLNFNMEDVFTAEIPPEGWLKAAENLVRLRLERLSVRSRTEDDNRTHVAHPINSRLVFPPWIVRAWGALLQIVTVRDSWRDTMRWLDVQGDCELSRTARELIEKTSWGTTITELSIPADIVFVSALTRLASRRWLNDGNIKLIVAMLTKTLPTPCKVWISDAALPTRLRGRYRAQGADAFIRCGDLRHVAERLISEGYELVLMPTNLAESHWVLFKVNLVKKTLSWGA